MSQTSPTLNPRTLRAQIRREKMVAHRSANFAEADQWDLDYWQSRTPQERIEAYVAIREDVKKVEKARAQQH